MFLQRGIIKYQLRKHWDEMANLNMQQFHRLSALVA